MNKSEKINIINELITQINYLIYDTNTHTEKTVINDVLSFIRNTLDEKNAAVWENKIIHKSWGVPTAHSPEAEAIRIKRWHDARKELIDILNSIKKEIEQFANDDTLMISVSNGTTTDEPLIFLSHNSTDKTYGDILRDFIICLGLKDEQLIYTSHSSHKIPFMLIFMIICEKIFVKIFI